MKAEIEAKRVIDIYLKVIKERTDVFNAYSDLSFAKECANSCVERIQELVYTMPIIEATFTYRKESLEYWNQVRLIINKAEVNKFPSV